MSMAIERVEVIVEDGHSPEENREALRSRALPSRFFAMELAIASASLTCVACRQVMRASEIALRRLFGASSGVLRAEDVRVGQGRRW